MSSLTDFRIHKIVVLLNCLVLYWHFVDDIHDLNTIWHPPLLLLNSGYSTCPAPLARGGFYVSALPSVVEKQASPCEQMRPLLVPQDRDPGSLQLVTSWLLSSQHHHAVPALISYLWILSGILIEDIFSLLCILWKLMSSAAGSIKNSTVGLWGQQSRAENSSCVYTSVGIEKVNRLQMFSALQMASTEHQDSSRCCHGGKEHRHNYIVWAFVTKTTHLYLLTPDRASK